MYSQSIYIIDDAADYRFLVQQVFHLFLPQATVRFFVDGAELVNELDEIKPEDKPKVIVLDIDMPRLNGFQTLERLKQHPGWQAVPVIMMTNRSDREFEQESYRLGASAFILKPMGLDSIRSVMTQLYEYEGDFSQLPAQLGSTK